MYPRNDQQRSRGMNCGFVQFKTRKQAENAKARLNGKDSGQNITHQKGTTITITTTITLITLITIYLSAPKGGLRLRPAHRLGQGGADGREPHPQPPGAPRRPPGPAHVRAAALPPALHGAAAPAVRARGTPRRRRRRRRRHRVGAGRARRGAGPPGAEVALEHGEDDCGADPAGPLAEEAHRQHGAVRGTGGLGLREAPLDARGRQPALLLPQGLDNTIVMIMIMIIIISITILISILNLLLLFLLLLLLLLLSRLAGTAGTSRTRSTPLEHSYICVCVYIYIYI